jgi:hypothetical protein
MGGASQGRGRGSDLEAIGRKPPNRHQVVPAYENSSAKIQNLNRKEPQSQIFKGLYFSSHGDALPAQKANGAM